MDNIKNTHNDSYESGCAQDNGALPENNAANTDEGRLARYGADTLRFAEAAAFEGLFLARVVSQHKDIYRAVTRCGEFLAQASGRMRKEACCAEDFPAVGDFIMTDRESDANGVMQAERILQRRSLFKRSAAGTAGGVQLIAANVDRLFICMSLNENYSLNRLERYLAAAWQSGAQPVAVLTKADLCADLEARLAEVRAAAPGAEVTAVSADDAASYQRLRAMLAPGVTASFIGSSGVGKSTLINRLAGRQIAATADIRADGKGRHTSTSREMFLLPGGGIVIDTPGMRSFGLDTADIERTFPEIDELAAGCRFSDCTHTAEPGCAVLAAIEEGRLDTRRLESWRKLRTEASYAGLSARQRENAKFNAMFKEAGGMKNGRKAIRMNDKRKKRGYE